MSFNSKYLPSIEEMKRIYSSCDSNEEFLKIVIGKSDSVIGPPDSFSFYEKVRDIVRKSNNR